MKYNSVYIVLVTLVMTLSGAAVYAEENTSSLELSDMQETDISTYGDSLDSTANGTSDTAEVSSEGDPDEPVITGTVVNPDTQEDEDAAVGERLMQPEYGSGLDEAESAVQRSETDSDFTTRVQEPIEADATTVRGWDPKKKEAILNSTTRAEAVASEDDLTTYVQGVTLEDENVSRISVDNTAVRVGYKLPARFLGVFDTEIEQETTIQFGDGEHGRVKVKFPWYRFLYRLPLSRTVLTEELESQLVGTAESGDGEEVKEGGNNTYTHKLSARIVETATSFFKSKREVLNAQ